MSQNILIINLTDSFLTQTSCLIKQLYKNSSNTDISYLGYENSSTLELIPGIRAKYFLNKKKIQKLAQKKIFYQSHSLNYFHQYLEKLKSQKWDKVYTLSYDKLSLYLAAYIANNKPENFYIDQYKNFHSQNKWSIYRKYIAPYLQTSFINEIELVNLEFNQSREQSVKLNIREDFLTIAQQNFLRLRKKINQKGESKKIIGIQFYNKNKIDVLSENELISLVNLLQKNKNFFPVLIISKSSYENEVIDFFNTAFDKKVVTIDSDYSALPAVFSHLDALITGDNLSLNIADSTDTPSIFITSQKDLRSSGSINTNNISIIKKSSESGISKSIEKALEFLTQTNDQPLKVEHNCFITRTDADDFIDYKQISGQLCYSDILNNYVHREFLRATYLGKKTKSFEQNQLFKTPEGLIHISQEKLKFTNIIKDLLDAVRCLKEAKSSQKHVHKFLQSYEKLLSHSEEVSIAQICLLEFKASVEQISSDSTNTNLKDLERCLFGLKNDLNIINNILNSLSQNIGDSKGQDVSL